MKPRFFRRRAGLTGEGPSLFRAVFSSRLPSAEHGLYFDVDFAYDWEPVLPQRAQLLHGDAVAQSLLTDRAANALCGYPILMACAAETAVNRRLSEEIRDDPRLRVTGRATVVVTKDTLLAARRRSEAAERHRVEEAGRISHLEVLRDLLLDRGLGLVWWIDRYADLQFAATDPKTKTESVLGAFRLVTDALRADMPSGQHNDNVLIRARVEELLGALEDPDMRKHGMDLLETILSIIAPASSTSERPEAGEQADPLPLTGSP